MISAIQFIKGYIMGAGEDKVGPEPDLNILFDEIVESESLNRVDEIDNRVDEIDVIEREINRPETEVTGDVCSYKCGQVTEIYPNYGIIDGKLYFELNNVPITNLHVGHKVLYLAYRREASDEWRVRKILSLQDEDWEENNKVNEDCSQVTELRSAHTRSIVGQVTHRHGRVIVVNADIRCCLDDVKADFTPIEGDWVILEALVEVDGDVTDLSGEVLSVDRVSALRSKVITGIVTQWDSDSSQGVIERDVFFLKDACEPGYSPCVQDRVVAQTIESGQGKMVWRALTVVPLDARNGITVAPDAKTGVNPALKELQLLQENKCGIVITDKLSFGVIKVGEVKDLVVEVTNNGSMRQLLLRGNFHSKRADSQLTLQSPQTDDRCMIYPSQKVEYHFTCRGKFVGHSSEWFVFTFKGFKIGRNFEIEVHDPSQAMLTTCETTFVSKNKSGAYNRARKILSSREKRFVIAGDRPIKPPAFVPVRLGVFTIPDRLWQAVLGSEDVCSKLDDAIVRVESTAPCLTADLSFANYCDRFHALLYLEEIEQNVRMRNYDMERVTFTVTGPGGDFLALEVPGLAEKRPSLMLGDRVLAASLKDNQALQYEGFVHKVCQKEVWLKFNANFHFAYDDSEYSVSFHFSRTPMRRCHSAVNLALNHLGESMLFPNSLKMQTPQLNFIENSDEDNEALSTINLPNKQESIGLLSHSLITPDKATPERSASVEEGKSSPRVPVVERLFRSKVHHNKRDATNNSITPKRYIDPDPLDYLTKLSQRAGKSSTAMDACPANAESSGHARLTNITMPTAPQISKQVMKLRWFNKKLNFYQKEAVKNVLRGEGRPLPYIIFGPPGTGKTITLVETILQILFLIPDSRLLVATPSNSSANLITERLLDSGILRPGDLVRLVGYHCLEEGTIPERLVPYCTTGDIRTMHGKDDIRPDPSVIGLKMSSNASQLGRHRITVGTCIALGQMYTMGFPRGHFTHVVVDEAGQATEPEILIPLGFLHTSWGQAVLAGDPLQLGPVVCSRVAIHFGLGESFLARLLHCFPYQRDKQGFPGKFSGYNPRLVTRLVMNYRSLPEILALPSNLFYDGVLEPQVSECSSSEASLLSSLASLLPQRVAMRPPALVFHGVRGTNCQDGDCPSWFNAAEIVQVVFYLNKLYAAGLEANDIGIITPYQKQVQKLRGLLSQFELNAPKIGSVEEFQGQERKVIILSVVRSSVTLVGADLRHALGFVASPHRLNVALTRARALLIVLGNPHLLSRDHYWRSVLAYCVERNAYTGCDLPQDMEDVLNEDELEKFDLTEDNSEGKIENDIKQLKEEEN